MNKLYSLIYLLFVFVPGGYLLAQPALELDVFPVSFTQPVDLVSTPSQNGMLYVVEKQGRIQAYGLADSTKTLFLDISGSVGTTSEGGLLGMAFHPAYPDSNYFYVNYTAPGQGGGEAFLTTISRFTVAESGTVDAGTELPLLTISQPADNHNGGDLAFGPDGYLYIPTGDGGGGGDPFDNAQDPQSLLGKLLRIDVDQPAEGKNYGIPGDNPFAGSADTLSEIWALGLRNPWRISFDQQTGDLWIGDVGQNQREEIDFQSADSPGGENYGWDCREGLIPYPEASDRCGTGTAAFTDPVIEYPHAGNGGFNGQSVTGGYVYRGPYTDLDGYYVFADFASPRMFLYDSGAGGDESVLVFNDLPTTRISTFGEGSDGALYVADFGGKIYEVMAGLSSSVPNLPAAELAVYPNPASDWLRLELPAGSSELDRIDLFQSDGKRVGEWVAPTGEADGGYRIKLPNLPRGLYVLTATGSDGRYTTQVQLD